MEAGKIVLEVYRGSMQASAPTKPRPVEYKCPKFGRGKKPSVSGEHRASMLLLSDSVLTLSGPTVYNVSYLPDINLRRCTSNALADQDLEMAQVQKHQRPGLPSSRDRKTKASHGLLTCLRSVHRQHQVHFWSLTCSVSYPIRP